MDRQSIQTAIAQTLENFQRCGVRWFGDNGEIPSEWSDAIASLATESTQLPSGQGGSSPGTAIGQSTKTTLADQSQTQPTNNSSSSAQSSTVQPSSTSAQRGGSPSDKTPAGDSRSEGLEPVHGHVHGQSHPSEIPGSWDTAELDDAARLNLFQILDQEIRACRKCTEICPYRRQTVFGEGPIRPTVCFMGEAPGAEEDSQGRPFIGPAGQLLTKIIVAMQLQRDQVYILNSLKCRPPGNRSPAPNEILNCYPFVESQLETLRPKYIVCLGAVAARSLLKRDTPVGQMRGRFFHYRGAKVLVTYHPSYLLRNDSAKRLVWEDMQLLMRELGITLPTKK